MAALLGTIYSVDAADCRLAGLLHDWDREIPKDELPRRARELGLGVGPIDELAPYILHARTAAAELKLQFPDLDTDIICAVENHTVGSPTMSELDMVVFIADMIEPKRVFSGVEDLRDDVGTLSLKDLFAACYQTSFSHLISVRKYIHPQTAEVWNALVARRQQ